MTTSKKYSREVRERAVRLVLDSQGQDESQWAAIKSVAVKIGCTAATLRKMGPPGGAGQRAAAGQAFDS